MPSLVDWSSYSAVLFDLDGVITPTAAIHEKAWAELFEPYGFTHADYLRCIDGRPRYDGVATFLASRDIELPWGDPSDPAGDGTISALGNRKNDIFFAILERDGVSAYPGTIDVLDLLDKANIPQAIVSSSRNARVVLDAAGLGGRFGVIVDGLTAAEENIAGKPAPDMFLRAAELLDAQVATTVVVEDASSGVAAGSAGGFGFVLGVDRGGNASALMEAGAHLVVEDLSETLRTPMDT